MHWVDGFHIYSLWFGIHRNLLMPLPVTFTYAISRMQARLYSCYST